MAEAELERELEEEAQAILREMEESANKNTQKKEAKRIVISHSFPNIPNHEWDDRKRRRNIVRRAGYRHPEDAALAIIDCYYCSHDVKAEPKTIAVSAIHAVGIMFNGRETQLDLGNQYDISPSSIQRYYRGMTDLIK